MREAEESVRKGYGGARSGQHPETKMPEGGWKGGRSDGALCYRSESPKTISVLRSPTSECPDIWMRLPRRKCSKIMVKCRRSSGSRPTILVWASACRTLMGETVRRSDDGAWMGKSLELGMPCGSPKLRVTLIGTCVRHHDGWKEAEYEFHAEEIDEECRFR